MSGEEIAVLFSGGTDSTLAAALMQESFSRVHLVTYDRFGLHAIENTSVNAKILQRKYGESKYVHRIMNVDRLFRHLSYERYFRNWYRYGFFLLSTCGLCKLAMHARTVQYCLDNGVKNVCDGASRGMSLFPDQMRCVMAEFRRMYAHFGLQYANPVYAMAPPREKGYVHPANLELIPALVSRQTAPGGETPGQKLYKLGLAPEPDVKGSPYDRERQARCFQLILFNFFALGYFNAPDNHDSYCRKTREFFKDKVAHATRLIAEHRSQARHGALFT